MMTLAVFPSHIHTHVVFVQRIINQVSINSQ
jgi:hypothetical protein